MPALVWRLLHVLALCTLAITQPLLDILGDNPTFFTAHDSSSAQVVWLAAVVALVPALVLGSVEVGVHAASPRLAERVHLTILAGLAFLVVIQIVDVLPGPWIVPVAVAITVTTGLVALYVAREGIRSVVSMLALTPIVFVALFLFVSPASSMVFPDDVDAVELDELLGDTFGSADPGAGVPAVDPPTLAEQVDQRFPPIHILVFDELPMASLLDESGEIDRARWPNFARLADTSHLFSNATTIGFTTERAIPGMLTGRYETQEAPVYSLYPENLFTLLGDIYDISSSDPLVDLCPPSICNGAPPQAMPRSALHRRAVRFDRVDTFHHDHDHDAVGPSRRPRPRLVVPAASRRRAGRLRPSRDPRRPRPRAAVDRGDVGRLRRRLRGRPGTAITGHARPRRLPRPPRRRSRSTSDRCRRTTPRRSTPTPSTPRTPRSSHA